jgi:hypothetical protein
MQNQDHLTFYFSPKAKVDGCVRLGTRQKVCLVTVIYQTPYPEGEMVSCRTR